MKTILIVLLLLATTFVMSGCGRYQGGDGMGYCEGQARWYWVEKY